MKYLKWIMDAALAVYLLVLLVVSAPGLAGRRLFAVTSPSMEPAIGMGAVVYVSRCPLAELKKGDVITFLPKDGEGTVTHRIEEIDAASHTVITKGDANLLTDARKTAEDDILGKVRFQIPLLGCAAVLLEGVWGRLLLLAALLWLAALEYVLGSTMRLLRRREAAWSAALTENRRYEE